MAECKNIMVYVETAEGNPVKVGLEMLSPAKKLADKVTAVVIGGGVADAAKEEKFEIRKGMRMYL